MSSPKMQTTATLVAWHPEEGWGLLEAQEVPDPIWVLWACFPDDYNWQVSLRVGQRFEVLVEDLFPHDQDGYRFRAEKARPIP